VCALFERHVLQRLIDPRSFDEGFLAQQKLYRGPPLGSKGRLYASNVALAVASASQDLPKTTECER
jgi:hypothetical protein